VHDADSTRTVLTFKDAAVDEDSGAKPEYRNPRRGRGGRTPAQPPSHAAARQENFESVNARIHKAVRARGHFPNEQAALKCVYMAIMSPDRTGQGRKRWSQRWKAALNAFEITFDGRLSAARR
jgi:hypothetical protein